MGTNLKTTMLLFAILFAGALSAQSQQKGITGSIFLYNEAGGNPIPLSGYEVYLYDRQSQKWMGPSITDAYGRYAFYGIQEGSYLLRIYMSETNWRQQVWQQEVQGPGEVKAIVLGSLYRIIPHVDYVKTGNERYNFSLWVDIPEVLKPSVKKVSYYFNHPSFSQKLYEITDPSEGYRFTYSGWGCLVNVKITVYLESRNIEIEFYMCDAIRSTSKK